MALFQKAKTAASRLGKVFDQGRTQLRGFATQSFDAIDNAREMIHPWLNKAENALNSQNVEKVRKLINTADSFDPRIAQLGLPQKYDMLINNSRTTLDKTKKGMAQLDKFMESETLKDIRQMTGTGLKLPKLPGGFVNGKGPAKLPENVRFMQGNGVPYNNYGLSYLRSLQ